MDLLARTRAAAARAAAEGALHFLEADLHQVDQGGVSFAVREIRGKVHKPHGTRVEDPFRPPYTDALYVSDWPPAHALLLNKFPVLPDHLLLVTRAWADQEEPVDRSDWDALQSAMDEVDGLGFYNGGLDSGASQPHRHLQLVARAGLGELPLEPAVRDAVGRGLAQVPGWPIPHRIGRPSFEDYRRDLVGPHSLLRTREWQLVVPRRTGTVDGIPVNSLAYLGLLAVKDQAQLAEVRARGPWWVLARAAG